MPDQDLRELERRYRQSETGEDLARWLVARRRAGELPPSADLWIERVESGDLTREQITLAGYLGDPGLLELDEHEAVQVASYLSAAAEIVPVVLDSSGGDVRAWVFGLRHWGESWVVEAQLAAAEAMARQPEPVPEDVEIGDAYMFEGDYLQLMALRQIEVARACLRDPSPANLKSAQEGTYAWESSHSQAVQASCEACDAAAQHARGEEVRDLYLGPADLEIARSIRAALVPRVLDVPGAEWLAGS